MGARKYDLVAPNYSALKADLKKFGLTADQVWQSMGKKESYISQLFRRNEADRKTVEAVEDRMFREHGSYYTEIKEAAETPTEPPKPQMTEGMGILLKQIKGAIEILPSAENVASYVGPMSEQMTGIRKEMANQTAVLNEILQKQKELTTLAAKILSNMERRQG